MVELVLVKRQMYINKAEEYLKPNQNHADVAETLVPRIILPLSETIHVALGFFLLGLYSCEGVGRGWLSRLAVNIFFEVSSSKDAPMGTYPYICKVHFLNFLNDRNLNITQPQIHPAYQLLKSPNLQTKLPKKPEIYDWQR